MDRNNVKYWKIGFLIILIVLSVFFTRIILSLKEGEVLISKMHLSVGDNPGFDINNDLIEFGRLPIFGTSKRFVTLENKDKTKFVHITAFGKLKDWVRVSDNNFITHANESKRISVMVIVPENAKKRDYTGFLKIKFEEVRNE